MILFVDDEARRMENHAEDLRLSGEEVVFVTNIDEAIERLSLNASQIELLILDIMMSPGSAFANEDTDGGLRTGLFLYEKVRRQSPRLPVIFFTNVSDEQLAERFNAEYECMFLQKRDYMPHEFTEVVRKMLARPRRLG